MKFIEILLMRIIPFELSMVWSGQGAPGCCPARQGTPNLFFCPARQGTPNLFFFISIFFQFIHTVRICLFPRFSNL
jgi:hypothetical protein